jgi:hypothetical protein
MLSPADRITSSRPSDPSGSDVPRLFFLVEFDDPIEEDVGERFADRLDAALAARNSEYSAKRKSGRYGTPVLRLVRSGEFDRYRRRMVEGGRSDGQFKILRLTDDPTFAGEFESERDHVGSAQP